MENYEEEASGKGFVLKAGDQASPGVGGPRVGDQSDQVRD